MSNLDYSKFLRKLYTAFNTTGNNGKVLKVNTSTGSPEFFDVTLTGGTNVPRGSGGTVGRLVTRVGNTATFVNLEPTAALEAFESGRVAFLGVDGLIYPGSTGKVTGLGLTAGKKYRLGAGGTLVEIPNPIPVGYPDSTLLNATTRYYDGLYTYQDGNDVYLYHDPIALVTYSSGVTTTITTTSAPTTAAPTTTSGPTTTYSPAAAQVLDIVGLTYNENISDGPVITEWINRSSTPSTHGLTLRADGDQGQPTPYTPSMLIKNVGGTNKGVFLQERNYSAGAYRRLTAAPKSIGGEITLRFQGFSSNFDTGAVTIFFGGNGDTINGSLYEATFLGNGDTDPRGWIIVQKVTYASGVRTTTERVSTTIGSINRLDIVGKWVWFKISVDGLSKTANVKIWKDGDTEPGWQGQNIPVPGLVAGWQGWSTLDGYYEISYYGATPQSVTGDTIPPNVTLTANPSSITTAGTFNLTANATDNIAVAKVDFYKGGAKLGTMTTPTSGSNYIYTTDVSALDNGTVEYKAIAFDTAGNSKQASVNVTINISSNQVSRVLDIAGQNINENVADGTLLTEWIRIKGASPRSVRLLPDGYVDQPAGFAPSTLKKVIDGVSTGVYFRERNYSDGSYKRIANLSPSVGGEIVLKFQLQTTGDWNTSAPTLFYSGVGDNVNGSHYEVAIMNGAGNGLQLVNKRITYVNSVRTELDKSYFNVPNSDRNTYSSKWIWFKLNVNASAKTASAKIWLEGSSEPEWMMLDQFVPEIQAGWQGWSSLDGWFEVNYYSSNSNATVVTPPSTTQPTSTSAPQATTTKAPTTTAAPTTTQAPTTTVVVAGELGYMGEFDFIPVADTSVLHATRGPSGTVVDGPVVYDNDRGLIIGTSGPTAKTGVGVHPYMGALINFQLDSDATSKGTILASDNGAGIIVYASPTGYEVGPAFNGTPSTKTIATTVPTDVPVSVLVSFEGTTIKLYNPADDSLIGTASGFSTAGTLDTTQGGSVDNKIRTGNRYSNTRLKGSVRYLAIAKSGTANQPLTASHRATMYTNMNAIVDYSKQTSYISGLVTSKSSGAGTIESIVVDNTITIVPTVVGFVNNDSTTVEVYKNGQLVASYPTPNDGNAFKYTESITSSNNGTNVYEMRMIATNGKVSRASVTSVVAIPSVAKNAEVLDIAGMAYDTNLADNGPITEWIRTKGAGPRGTRLLEDGNAAQAVGAAPSTLMKTVGGTQKGVYLYERNYSDGSYKRISGKAASLGGEMLIRFQSEGIDWNAGMKTFYMGGVGDMNNGSWYEFTAGGNTGELVFSTIRKGTFTNGVYDAGTSIATKVTDVPKLSNTWYWVRVRVDAATKKMYARIWQDGQSEPVQWTLSGVSVPDIQAGWQGWNSLDGRFEMNYYSSAPQGGVA